MTHLLSISIGCLSLAMTCGAQVPNWTKKTTNPTPEWRQNHDMVYDSSRGVCVMFGGWTSTAGGTRNAALNDTWEWDGTSWKQITTITQPPRWAGHAMAYDSRRKRTVVTGNNQAATWEYDGKDWKMMNPATQAVLAGHRGMTYDSGRGVCVFFGERNGANETWEYDGINWKKITTVTSPPNSTSASLAYDSLRQVTVMFTFNAQTWEYDGTNWQQANPTTTPPGRSCRYGMVYDDARQVVVMFGGCGAAAGDSWEYDGVNWRQHTTTSTPPFPRRYVAMSYDSQRRRTVLFGGRDLSGASPVVVNDTWEYSRGDCFMIPDIATIDVTKGGTQKLEIDAGTGNAVALFWIFGSISGTSPGFPLNGSHMYLMPDAYTELAAYTLTNTAFLVNFRGVLDGSGKATARFVLPPSLITQQVVLHHAYWLYPGGCTGNPVPLWLK